MLTAKSNADSDVAAHFQGRGGQTADIIRIGNDTAIRSRLDNRGLFITNIGTAPADSDLANGDVAFYVESTGGAMKPKIKARDANGTIHNREVALS